MIGILRIICIYPLFVSCAFSGSHVQMNVQAISEDSSVLVNEWRLPEDVRPVFYDLRLFPFIEEGNFTTDGFVEIAVECVRSTSSITFHSVDTSIVYSSIQISSVTSNQSVNVIDTFEDLFHQTVTLTTATPLIPGETYKLTMKFVSVLGDQLVGFYRASYIENGVRKWYAVTDFEAPDARRAFPCFDEPQMKAVFRITLGRKEFMTSISNMPLKETISMEGVAGYAWDIFETSPEMSTYLVAFMVSEMTYKESDPSLSNVQFRIWSRPEAVDQLEYSSTAGPLINEFFEEYFGVDYALPKQDMVAVTERNSGAMENWGLVTYREYNLFFDEQRSSVTSKRGISEVIAHELAHQWTGNLVTLQWWSELWLNEGFARYLQFIGSDAVEPSFRGNETILVRTVHPLLVTDSVPTRPIYVDVNTPAELAGMFNTITYDKGACVIRMMAGFLGEETFRRGMNSYLTRNAFGNAESVDLFQAMNDQAISDNIDLPTDVKTILESWTLKMGYPLINVTRQYPTGGATIAQDRFLRTPLENSTDPTVYRWWVPLTYRNPTNPSINLIWMSWNESSMEIRDLGASSDQWVIFNIDQVGFYRVIYDPVNYGHIRDQLVTDHGRMSTNNRAQLLDDAFNLASLNFISYSDAFDLTLYLSRESEFIPWEAVLPELDYIYSMLLESEVYGALKNYMSGLVGPYLNHVGFSEPPKDDLLSILSRTNAIDWACKLGIPECTRNAQLQYSAWMNSPADVEVISRHQKSIILCTGIEHGDESAWDYAYRRFLNPLDPGENGIILNALACTKLIPIHQRMLDMLLDSSSGIVDRNAVSLFNALADNPTANAAAFDFLDDNWNALSQTYADSMPSFYRAVSARYNTPAKLQQMLTLKEQHSDVLGNSSVVDQAVASVEANIKWMDGNLAEISDWLDRTNENVL